MNQKFINTILFATGAAIGSLVTWKIMKTNRERIVQEEIDSFKATYSACMGGRARATESFEKDNGELEEEDADPDDADVFEYDRLVNAYKGSNEEGENVEEGEGDYIPYINGPYVISPEDFADGNYDYDCISLTYYADGVLADDWGVKMDIDETIGDEALEHFGDYEDDIVHVRNERKREDYEVARDPRKYVDVVNDTPLMRTYAN